MENTVSNEIILSKLIEKFGENAVIRKKDIEEFVRSIGFDNAKFLYKKDNKVSWGTFRLPTTRMNSSVNVSKVTQIKDFVEKQTHFVNGGLVFPLSPPKFDPNAVSEHEYAVIPEKDKHYVAFGDFTDVEKVIKSRLFFPIFISGLSGNGKTFMVEQACARGKQKMIRVQLSRETDEDDLMGGFRLINGETKFIKGPVVRAMELGALLLLDEADRADPGKIMCLQGVLEGKPYFVKKTGEVVYPKEGFNIIVTANTKGKGSDDGRYISVSILDDAWLERFPITLEQKYPTASIERKILNSYMSDDRQIGEDDNKFIEMLISWAEIIRKTFDENAIDEVISTRRLVHIVKTYQLFGDRMRAINLCINRFDEETKTAFINLYTKIDETANPKSSETAAVDLTTTTAKEVHGTEISF